MSEIYALSDDFYTPQSTIKVQILQILQSGIKLIQFRCKNGVYSQNLLKELVVMADDFGAKFIVNDDVNLAKTIGAHGVHVGQDDGSVKSARELLGAKAIIGASCYDSLDMAQNALNQGASYIAFGAMYESKTKSSAPLCPFSVVQEARSKFDAPLCVIGGIKAKNLPEILALKPDYIAVVSAVYEPHDIGLNLANLNKILGK